MRVAKKPTWREQNPEAFNERWRAWYRKNAKRKMAWQKERKDALRQWWRELKATKACEECGERAPECLHFHHPDPATKEISLSNAVGWALSRRTILAELAKCRVLCANCHLKHHWNARQRKWSG